MRKPVRIFGISSGIVVALVVVAFIVCSLIGVSEVAITPGTATNVTGLIRVPSSQRQHHKGAVFLTDVELVESMKVVSYLYYRYFDHDAQVLPTEQVEGNATNAQYNEQGSIDMANARQAAIVSALHELGYRVTSTPNGVVIYGTTTGSPASSVLSIGSVVVAINQRPTLTITKLQSVLRAMQPGALVRLTIHNIGTTSNHTVSVRIGSVYQLGTGASEALDCFATPTHNGATLVKQDGAPVPCLGVEVEQLYRNGKLPFPITLDADGIIGPSAGLAFTLGLIEALDHADLTNGMRIAATGTISISGAVGDVGGVAQKTIAVRNAGATVFFVPLPEKAVARAHAGPHLRIFAVNTLHQAVEDLEKLGGHISLASPTS